MWRMPYFSSAVHLQSLCFISLTPSPFDKVVAPIHLQTTLQTCPHQECLAPCAPPIDPPHLSLLIPSTPSPVSYLTHSFPHTSLPLRGLSPMLARLFPHKAHPSCISSLVCLFPHMSRLFPGFHNTQSLPGCPMSLLLLDYNQCNTLSPLSTPSISPSTPPPILDEISSHLFF